MQEKAFGHRHAEKQFEVKIFRKKKEVVDGMRPYNQGKKA